MSKKYIITAFAESAAGPGWANSPVWVVVKDGNGQIGLECIQPSEQTAEIATLYSVSSAAHWSMTRAVRKALKYE